MKPNEPNEEDEQNKQDLSHSLIANFTADNKEYIHFLKLDTKKQERVLAAAYGEFLEKGYGEASTNSITKKAGISKGLLFHYFGNKEGLYKFLMKEAVRRIASETLPDLQDKDGNVFTIIESIIQLKISVCLQYPMETNFMISAWEDHLPENLLRELENMVGMSNDYLTMIINLLDSRLLQDGIEKTVAAEIISWVCEKYTEKLLSNSLLNTDLNNWNNIAEDLKQYMNALKHGLYK